MGIAVIGWALLTDNAWATIAGAAESYLVVPAIRDLKEFRKQNALIRLMEIPLASAKTADQANNVIMKLFSEQLGKSKAVAKKSGR